jgi:hypothetical protein
MSTVRIVWFVGILLAAGALYLVLSGSPAKPAVAPASVMPGEAAPASASPSTPSTPSASVASSTPAASSAPAAAPAASTPAAEPAPAPRAPVVRSADAVNLGLDHPVKEAKVIAGNIVPRKDEKTGEMLLYADGKYEIRGEGTAAKPYRVSWECLASASETYVPRLQQREIPQRIAMLDGKVVEVEGYLAFPLMVSETKELLVMLNQWDGCCIGVPPTPYDAVEVKLTEPAKRGGKHASFNFGGVRGTLKVDPYLVENWLVGLYVMDNAQMVEGAKPEL